MNDRIRELAEQAKFMAEEDINRQISYNTELKAFAEKFAELIVRECINQCAHAPDVSEDWYQGVKWVANEIAQHFGIEE
jgi:hypothetical protein